MMDLLSRTTIVLVEPRTPENVGSIARAMANLGLPRLVIVGSPGIQDAEGALRLAVDARGILTAAESISSFQAARQSLDLAIGTTAHQAYETWDLLDPASAVAVATQTVGTVGFVFGSERYGLSKADLRLCDQVLHLPTAQPDASLNLAQAVLIVAWELWRSRAKEPPPPRFNALEMSGGLTSDWIHLLRESGFLKPHNEAKKLATLRRILSRLQLSASEVAALEGLGSKLTLYVGERSRSSRPYRSRKI